MKKRTDLWFWLLGLAGMLVPFVWLVASELNVSSPWLLWAGAAVILFAVTGMGVLLYAERGQKQVVREQGPEERKKAIIMLLCLGGILVLGLSVNNGLLPRIPAASVGFVLFAVYTFVVFRRSGN